MSFLRFQIVFEGIVGKNSLGNIAIDDVSVAPGVCPSKFLEPYYVTNTKDTVNLFEDFLMYQAKQLLDNWTDTWKLEVEDLNFEFEKLTVN